MPLAYEIDTRERADAVALGYDRACDPTNPEDGEGLICAFDGYGRPSFTLTGPDGEVTLYGERQMREVVEAIERALLKAQRVVALRNGRAA